LSIIWLSIQHAQTIGFLDLGLCVQCVLSFHLFTIEILCVSSCSALNYIKHE